MTTLDQVRLLEEKVEGIVAKLQQLQAENDALRTRCDELTNALSSKTEQLTTYTTDQNEIEDGLKKALDRLNYIENSVLKTKGSNVTSNGGASIQITPGQTGGITNQNINTNQINHSQVITPGSSGIMEKASAIENNIKSAPAETQTKPENINFNSMKEAPAVNKQDVQDNSNAENLTMQEAEKKQEMPINFQNEQENTGLDSAENNNDTIEDDPVIEDDFSTPDELLNDINEDDSEGDQDALGFDIF